jgi:hypothetical protein
MAESSVVASRASDWAAVDAAWRRSLARGVCAILELVCSTAIVLFCAKHFNAAFHIGGSKNAALAETTAVNFCAQFTVRR